MGWLARLWRRPAAPAPTPQAAPAVRFGVLSWESFPWWDAARETVGKVDRAFALSVPSVLGARNIVCGTIASLPLRAVDGDNRPIRSPLLEQIDPDAPNPVTMAMLIEDLLFESIGWWRVLARDWDGYPTKARRIDPRVVSVQPPPGVVLEQLPSGYVPGSTLWVAGEPVQVRDMIRFDSPHPPILVHGARAIRRAYALEAAAEMYAREPAARAWFTPKEGYEPDQSHIDSTLADWEARRKAGATGYVPPEYTLNESRGYTPAELQLASLIDKATVAIADLFGLDSEDLNVSTTSRTYANAVDRRYDKVLETYAALTTAVAARLSMGDITRRGQRVEFDWSRYLTPNPSDRANIAKTYIDAKVLTPDEVRRDEGRAPLTDEQRVELRPSTPAPATAPAAEQQQTGALPAGPAAGGDVVPFPRPTNVVNFAGSSVRIAFAAPDVEAPLTVDEQRRTITGLVLPWGQIGRVDGQMWRFAPGSLRYDPAHVDQIKLFADHDPAASVGYVIRTWSDDVGQWATFKIARGPAGDAALLAAADRAKDGLSVGIGYAGEDSGIVAIDDPENPGGILVLSAPWRETSQVALPAFEGARVTAVTMSADNQGVSMSHPTQAAPVQQSAAPAPQQPQQSQAAPAPQSQAAPVQFASVDLAQLLRQAMQSQAAPVQQSAAPAPQQPQQSQAAPAPQSQAAPVQFSSVDLAQLLRALVPDRPATVDPLALPLPGQQQSQQRPTVTTSVTEPPLYRFDGNPGQRSLLADIRNGFGGSAELRAQAERFIADAMKAAFANVTTTNVSSLNPTIQRPDLYVPRLTFTRPMGSMVTGGVVDSITKSTLPKFQAASGLVGTHTQGTEPTEGTFATTSQDIEPKAISGLLKINREVIDQGGSPQADQVMWATMTQFYAELLEQRLEDLLASLSLTPVPIVGTDTALQQAVKQVFAGFQYIRGGDRYSALAVHQAFYTALTSAVDNDGRSLFPMEAPSNVDGATAGDLSSVRVAGKRAVPAWALETANGGPATPVSYLWVPSSVYQWFSPPRRIDLNAVAVAHVEIGIWGYSAEFVVRDSDVIELTYAESE